MVVGLISAAALVVHRGYGDCRGNPLWQEGPREREVGTERGQHRVSRTLPAARSSRFGLGDVAFGSKRFPTQDVSCRSGRTRHRGATSLSGGGYDRFGEVEVVDSVEGWELWDGEGELATGVEKHDVHAPSDERGLIEQDECAPDDVGFVEYFVEARQAPLL